MKSDMQNEERGVRMSFEVVSIANPKFLEGMRDRSVSSSTFRRWSNIVTNDILCAISPRINGSRIVPILVLRAGIAFFETVLRTYPDVPMGMVGMERMDIGPMPPQPKNYYWKVPPADRGAFWIVFDPMLATGGTMVGVMQRLLDEKRTTPGMLCGVSCFAAPEGVRLLQEQPWGEKVRIFSAALDQGLDSKSDIVPGCEDYGNRYFGTESGSGLYDTE